MYELLRELYVHLVRVSLDLILRHLSGRVLHRAQTLNLFLRRVQRLRDVFVTEPPGPVRGR